MCGLIGMFGSLFQPDKTVFKQGLIASSFRGPHSTGIGYALKDGAQGYYKKAINAQSYLDFRGVDKTGEKEIQWSVSGWIDSWFSDTIGVIGHNRWATLGEVKDANAHPFQHGHILLAHNGGIRGHHRLTKDYFAVDSEAIAKRFEEVGAVAALKEIDGDFALSWHDGHENTFNLIRNAGRPLWLAEHAHRNAWYYASERDMLVWILNRNNIKFINLRETGIAEHIIWNPKAPARLETIKRELYQPRFQGYQGDYYGRGRWGWENEWEDRGPYSSRQPIGPTVVTQTTEEGSKVTKAVGEATTAIALLSERREARVGQEFLARQNGQLAALSLRTPNAPKVWDEDRGLEWLRNLGLVADDNSITDNTYIGHFDTWESYPNNDRVGRPITAASLKNQKGRILGKFDSQDEVDCILRRDNCDLLEFADSKGEFVPSYFAFKIEKCRWNSVEGAYVIFVSELQEIDWEASDENDIWNLSGIKRPVIVHEVDEDVIDHEPLSLLGDEEVPDQYIGYNGRVLSGPEWDRRTKHGCSHCTLQFDDDSVIHWLDDDSPLCGTCMDNHFGIQRRNGVIDLTQAVQRMLH